MGPMFGNLYTTVVTEKHPERKQDLLAYLRLIFREQTAAMARNGGNTTSYLEDTRHSNHRYREAYHYTLAVRDHFYFAVVHSSTVEVLSGRGSHSVRVRALRCNSYRGCRKESCGLRCRQVSRHTQRRTRASVWILARSQSVASKTRARAGIFQVYVKTCLCEFRAARYQSYRLRREE